MTVFQPSKRLHLTSRVLLIVYLLSTMFLAAPQITKQSAQAYIDPALSQQREGSVSVIVTANSSETAATAVQAIGGQVTSNLSLINAVGAIISANQIDTLAQTSGIISIINNHAVTASNGPDCTGEPTEHGPCALPPGWVTDHREKKENIQLPVSLKYAAGLAQLPDGGFVAIAEKQYVAFANPDGSVRLLINNLAFEKLASPPVVSENGIVYFMGSLIGDLEKAVIYAIDSQTGSVIWKYDRQKNLVQGVALSPDGQFLYVLSNENKAKLYIFEAATGSLITRAEPRTNNPGIFAQPPLVAPDGTIYLQSTGKEPYKDNRFSNVIALNPIESLDNKGASLWRFEASFPTPTGVDELIELDMAPLHANGYLYLFSNKNKVVFALNIETGQVMHRFDVPKSLVAPPTVGADGTLYLPADKLFYALNPDLTIRFEFVSDGKFSTPVFSLDGTAAYTSLNKTLYAISTETGEQLWQVTLKGNIHARPSVDPQGNVIVGSDGKDMLIVTPQGHITTRLRLDANFSQVVSTSLPNDQIMVLVGDKNLLTIGRLSDTWNSDMVDVQPTEIKDEWEIVNTISIDIGADIVHNTSVPLPDKDGHLVPTNITGAGITIAVIDSGVYVDKHVKDLLSSDLYATDIKEQYIGQYDFVGDGRSPGCKINENYNVAEGYCYFDWDKSRDPYGHGSHVAGIIWSQITDASTSASMGIAPGANVISIRVLGDDGTGTYEDVVQGIQWVVDNQNNPNLENPIRVMNLSLSAEATVPYFVDPINRAVEQAWASGIVVLAAAGNVGPEAQTITVPGNDPYIITVGAINNKRTPGYWADDEIPHWSSSGPTLDGFIKPDVLAPGSQIISFMHNDDVEVARLLQDHPDYSETMSLFRMNGTSMATAVTSGVVALMLEAEPNLTPDQVKYRLMASAKPMITEEGFAAQSVFRQGIGRIWVPDAVLWDDTIPTLNANQGMDIEAELANPWVPTDDPDPVNNPSLAHHYVGPIQYAISDDNATRFYFTQNPHDDMIIILGAIDEETGAWLTYEDMADRNVSSEQTNWVWNEDVVWAGGYMLVGIGSNNWAAPGNYVNTEAGGYMLVGIGGYMLVGIGGYMLVGIGGYMLVGIGGYMLVGIGGYMLVGIGNYVGAESYQTWASSNPIIYAQHIAANRWVEDDRPEGFTVHVADLDGAPEWVSRDAWQQTVTITTRDEYQSRIANTIVTGIWSNGQTASCLTDQKGECTVTSTMLTSGVSSINFTVTNVQHQTLLYVSHDNLDLDGDSNGTLINAIKPFHPTVSVNDMDAVSEWKNSTIWALGYTIAVVDNENQPVPGATLTAKWTKGLSGTVSCTTDTDGLCVITVESIADSINEVELEVLGIDHWLLNYNKDGNTDVDGGSNGTRLKALPPAYRPSLHVADLDGVSAWHSSTTWDGSIVVTVIDDQGNPAADATVTGLWKKGLTGNATCITDTSGQCIFNAGTLPETITQIEMEITAVSHAMLHYVENNNDDPDNDSDGSKITVVPPAYRPGMRVSNIAGTSSWTTNGMWQVEVTFTVLDDQQQPVADAVVIILWKRGLSGTETCVTNSSGQCTLTRLVSEKNDKVELEVFSLTHSLLIEKFGQEKLTVVRP